MGVTIDSISIEIESNSASAAQGIDNFVKSLDVLKKSGKLTTVIKNLNSLSSAIKGFSSVWAATTALSTLANSIEKLKNAGSIASQATSLTKLQTSLKALESVNIGTVAPKVQELASALKPLSEVKSGGFGTLINSLSKLSEVTKSLDDDTIAAFAEKVALLNEKLGPFADKMATVNTAFKNIQSNSKQAAEEVDDFGEGIDSAALNMSSFVAIARAVIEVIQKVVQGFKNIIGESIEWDGISARFGRGFGSSAQGTYEWIQRLNEEMGINVQQFMKYSSVYATMLNGFGVAHEDAGKMALGYTELTYDIWAGYNDIYKTFDEAAEAVKSAIAGEVEPVRRAGFTIIESTLEQTAANHGLEISLENATEAQKSYLRYLTLVDQAHTQGLVGTYAAEMNTAEGLTRTLAQQTKSLSQAFGSLFLPILVKILPYVQAFVELLTDAVHRIAGIFGIEIQAVDFSGYESGTKVLDAVANSAGGAADSLGNAVKAAKDLKKATIGIDELNVISPESASSGTGSGSTGGTGGAGFSGIDNVNSLWDESIFDGIQNDVDEIKGKLKGWLAVIGSIAAALGTLRIVKLLKDLKGLEAIKNVKIFSQIKEFFLAAKQMSSEVGWLKALFPKLASALSKIGGALAGISAPAWAVIAAIIAAIASAVVFLVKNWEKFKVAVKEFFAENISPKLKEIGEHFNKIKAAIEPLKPIFEWFKNKAFPAIGVAIEWLGGIIVGIVGGAIMGTINSVVQAFTGLVQYISGAFQVLSGFFQLLWGLITGNGDKIKAGFQKIVSGIADSWKGLYKMTIGAIVEFFDGVINWFKKMWDILVGHSIVPDTINAIVKWFTSLPSKIFGSIEKFVTGIVDKFKGLWSKLVSWWNGKTKLKEYTPSIGSIYDKLKSRWDSARVWWNDKKTKAKEYTPSIGSIYEKLSERWKNARDWWNSKKGSMSFTPSIGSITDKIKSAWNSAKSWWSKNAKLSTKLNISVPKLTVNWGEVSALGKTFRYPKSFSLKFAANGGMFSQGSLIWAGERGPEIMANAGGGKTGVMNVQQMSEAMYEAVYSAMTAVMGSREGGSQEVRVYLDGREITSTVKKYQHESGAEIMGFSF